MQIIDILSPALRIAELGTSAVVTGLTAQYLHASRSSPASSKSRFIYTIVVSSLGILCSLIFLLPLTRSFVVWPVDLGVFVLFMVAFGILAGFIAPMNCGSVFNWHGITGASQCSKFKADIAFCFLASIVFLVSALLGLWVMHRRTRIREQRVRRRRWYRSRV